MSQHVASKASPLTIEQLALEKRLGSLQKIHKDTYFIFLGSLVYSIILLGMALLLAIGMIISSNPLGGWIGSGSIIAIGIAVALTPVLANYGVRHDRTLLYEYGLINKRGHHLQAICWDEIRYITTSSSVESVWTTATLHLKDGTMVETDNGARHIQHFMRHQIRS